MGRPSAPTGQMGKRDRIIMCKHVGLVGSGLFLVAFGYWVPRLYAFSVTSAGSKESAVWWAGYCLATGVKVTPTYQIGCSEGRSILTLGWIGVVLGLCLCLYAAWVMWRKPGLVRRS